VTVPCRYGPHSPGESTGASGFLAQVEPLGQSVLEQQTSKHFSPLHTSGGAQPPPPAANPQAAPGPPVCAPNMHDAPELVSVHVVSGVQPSPFRMSHSNAAASPKQDGRGYTHAPDSQASPAQHGADAEHAKPPPPQAWQLPEAQMPEQQSLDSVHCIASSLHAVHSLPAHWSPLQQSLALAQGPPAAAHDVHKSFAQTPLQHSAKP
jgi:hypothetical protein